MSGSGGLHKKKCIHADRPLSLPEQAVGEASVLRVTQDDDLAAWLPPLPFFLGVSAIPTIVFITD